MGLQGSATSLKAFRLTTGAFLLTGLCLSAGLLALLAQRMGWFQPSLNVVLTTSSSHGLSRGTPVRVSGVQVGVISDIQLKKDGKVRIRLRISDRYRYWVTPASRARLTRASLLSNGSVDVSPAPMPTTRPNHDGFEIAATNTVDLETLLAGAETTRTHLDGLLRSTKQVTSRDVPATLQSLSELLSEGSRVGANVNRELPPTLQQLQATLGEGRQSAAVLRKDLPPVIADVRATVQSVGSTSKSAETTLRNVEPEVIGGLQKFSKALEHFNSLMQKIDPLFDPMHSRRSEPVTGSGSAGPAAGKPTSAPSAEPSAASSKSSQEASPNQQSWQQQPARTPEVTKPPFNSDRVSP